MKWWLLSINEQAPKRPFHQTELSRHSWKKGRDNGDLHDSPGGQPGLFDSRVFKYGGGM
jgi:hypothetical protein